MSLWLTSLIHYILLNFKTATQLTNQDFMNHKKSYPKLKIICLILAGILLTSCQSVVDLRVSPVPAKKNATPVHIASILDLSKEKNILPKGRTRSDLIREALTDALHKKGYKIGTEATKGSIPLNLKIYNLSIHSEDRSKPTTNFFRSLNGERDYYSVTVFDIKVLVTGAIFHDSKSTLFENKVTWKERDSKYEFSNKGMNQFRANLKEKIKESKSYSPSAPPAKRKVQTEIKPTTKSEWVSKEATYSVSSSDPSRKALPSLLTYEGEFHGESGGQYAVHSDNSNDPYIIIDLGEERVIDRVVINGRRGFRTRQRHLAIWVSNDKSFDHSQPMWNARKSLVNYTIVLWKRPKGRYVKLGVVGKGILNLKGVKVLGW